MRDVNGFMDLFKYIVSGEVMNNVFLNMRIQSAAAEEIEYIDIDDPVQMDGASKRLADFMRASVENLFPLTDGRAIGEIDIDEVREGLPARLVAAALSQVDWHSMARGMIRDMAKCRRMQSQTTDDNLGGGRV